MNTQLNSSTTVEVSTSNGNIANAVLASENDEDEFNDPTLTLKRLKSFFEKYPKGVIEFT